MGGVFTHASWSLVGRGAPPSKLPLPMRHTKPPPSCTVPAVLKPPSCSRPSPLDDPMPQPRTIGPPQCPKSTATTAPVLGVHCETGAAVAAGAATTAAAVTAPETSAVAAARARRRRAVTRCAARGDAR